MRFGPEQFLIKSFAFYDAMVTPAIGAGAVLVYEVLRRSVWRDGARGSKRLRDATKGGKLVASVTRKKLATLTGLSVRKVQAELNTLRALGWIQAPRGTLAGEALMFEMGERRPGQPEVFYADGILWELWLALEKHAEERGCDRLTDLTCQDRLEFTSTWFDARRYAEEGGVQELPTPCAEDAQGEQGGVQELHTINREPFGENIEKSKEYMGREAPQASPGSDTGTSGRSTTSEQVSCTGSRARDVPVAEEQQEDGPAFALDSALDEEETQKSAEDRRRAAEESIARSIEKTAKQRAENERRREKREQAKANLKGTVKGPTVRNNRTKLFRVWTAVLRIYDPKLRVSRWDGKSHGQVDKLVELYDVDLVATAMAYMVENWDTLRERYFKGKGGTPTIGLLLSLHESLFREAQLWSRHRAALDEWDRWNREHPNELYPPEDLASRHKAAQTALEALGLGG